MAAHSSHFSQRVLFIVTTIALTACAGFATPSPMGRSPVDGTLSTARLTPEAVKPRFRYMKDAPRLRPDCCVRQKTLFVTDSYGGSQFAGAVYAFDYVTGALLGTVAPPPEGWNQVQGACNDDRGHVFIVNTGANDLDEFTHSGAFVKTIAVPGQFPANCAYDPASGDLAIGDIISASGGAGNIQIYKHGNLSGPFYPPNMNRVYWLAFEGKTRRLWFDGSDSSGNFQYDAFVDRSFTPVPIQGATINFPGTVTWGSKTKTMMVGDQDTFSSPTFYEVTRTGKVVGVITVPCENPSDYCDFAQVAIKGSGFVGPDTIALTVSRYAYPAGGAALLSYPANWIGPIGVAISPNAK